MRIDEELIFPYSLAIGIWNIPCTIATMAICYFIFNIPITQEKIVGSYLIGYVILFMLNLKSIEE